METKPPRLAPSTSPSCLLRQKEPRLQFTQQHGQSSDLGGGLSLGHGPQGQWKEWTLSVAHLPACRQVCP